MLARAARWLTSRLERLPTSERWAASTWAQAGERLAASMPFAEPVAALANLKGEKRGLRGSFVTFVVCHSQGVQVCAWLSPPLQA